MGFVNEAVDTKNICKNSMWCKPDIGHSNYYLYVCNANKKKLKRTLEIIMTSHIYDIRFFT